MKVDLCFGCMEQFTAYPCPNCGYDPKDQALGYALRPGIILNGKYLLGKVLGQGGFGITYIGWDLALERKVAIKEFFPTGRVSRVPGTLSLQWYATGQGEVSQQDAIKITLREARKMTKVEGIREVVQVHDTFQDNATAYIVMDLIKGQTLMDYVAKNGPMSWPEAKKIFLPAIQAMEQVHQTGLIHRDLSPDNLMLEPGGGVKILDLGAAKDVNTKSGVSSMKVAKKGFSPLEQYVGHGKTGPWTDVYAMAATIYYALTATMPPSAVDRMDKETLRWDTASLLTVPPNVVRALKQALVIQADNRTQSMAAFAENLQNNRKRVDLKRAAPLIAGGAAAVLALALGVGALAGGGDGDDTPSGSFKRPTATPDVEANIHDEPDYASFLGSDTDDVYTFANGVQASMYFDEDGLERCRVYTDGDGQRLYIFTAEYNEDGDIIQQGMYDGDGAVRRVDLWEYSGDGDRLSYSMFDADMTRQRLTMWEYDAQGRVTALVRENSYGDVLYHSTSTYDSDGTRTSTWEDSDGASGTDTYDAEGNLLERIYLDQDGKLDHRSVYFYDSTGKQTEQQYYDNKDLLSSRWEYKYQGDLLAKELYYSGDGSYSSTYTKLYGPHDICFGEEYENEYSHDIHEEIRSIDADLLQYYSIPVETTDHSTSGVTYYTWMGELLLSESYNMDGSPSSRTEYHVDEDGISTGSTYTYYSSYSDTYTVTERDADHNNLSAEKFDLDGNLVGRTEYEYDGNTHIEREFDADGTLTETVETIYNEYMDVLSRTTYDADGVMAYKNEYHYDDDGRETGRTWTYRSSYDGSITVTEYDADGNEISEKTYDPNGKVIRTK